MLQLHFPMIFKILSCSISGIFKTFSIKGFINELQNIKIKGLYNVTKILF